MALTAEQKKRCPKCNHAMAAHKGAGLFSNKVCKMKHCKKCGPGAPGAK